jgi:hypothetical protein
VLVSLGDGLVVSVGDHVGLSVMVGVSDGPGDALGTSDVAGLGVAEAAVQPAGVTGSADETAAAILGSGVARTVAVAAVVAGWHVDVADERGEAVPVARVLAPD